MCCGSSSVVRFRLYELEQQNRQLREAQLRSPFEGMIATDDAMLKVCRMIEKVAPADVSVLILGESGTGKELIARAVHSQSGRKDRASSPSTARRFPRQLLESELFGYEKGAFTGAVKQTLGKIETASGGTLFLDEIGDMPMALQAKLLRFLQDRVIERVGGRQEIPVRRARGLRDQQGSAGADRRAEIPRGPVSSASVRSPSTCRRCANGAGGPTVIAHALLRKFNGAQGRPKRGFTEDATRGTRSLSLARQRARAREQGEDRR